MLTEIFKEVLLSGLVDGKGEEDKREPASLMKQESKDGVQYNPLDAGALVEGGKVIGQNSFKMAGQVTSKQLDNVDEDGPKKSTFIKVKEPKEFYLVYESFVCSVCLTSSFSGYHRGFCCLSRMGCNRFGLHY